MIEPAIKYETQLKEKFVDIMFNPKYQFYFGQYSYFPALEKNNWNCHDFVSVNSKGDVIGYIGYTIIRAVYKICDLKIINFSDKDTIVFSRDLGNTLKDIFEKYAFNKLEFNVYVGNPIEKSYDKACLRYGGRIVGVSKNHIKLQDGKIYDNKMYEILKEDYFKAINKSF